MSTGFGFQGAGRCYPIWRDFALCKNGSANPGECTPFFQDYITCTYGWVTPPPQRNYALISYQSLAALMPCISPINAKSLARHSVLTAIIEPQIIIRPIPRMLSCSSAKLSSLRSRRSGRSSTARRWRRTCERSKPRPRTRSGRRASAARSPIPPPPWTSSTPSPRRSSTPSDDSSTSPPLCAVRAC